MPYKTCVKCNSKNGVRTKICKCGQQFTTKIAKEPNKIESPTKKKWRKKKKPKLKYVKWTELKQGNIIYVTKGPYYVNKDNVRIGMGEKGTYKVLRFEKNGIIAFERNKDCTGYAFIYCGPKEFNEKLGIWRRPHRIKLLKESEDVQEGKN